MGGAPLLNPFFRPEEEHVASGENNVVPPLGRGNKAMKKPAARAADLPDQSPVRAVHRIARSVNEPAPGDAAAPVSRMNPRRS